MKTMKLVTFTLCLFALPLSAQNLNQADDQNKSSQQISLEKLIQNNGSLSSVFQEKTMTVYDKRGVLSDYA